jgi:hypothetical protein
LREKLLYSRVTSDDLPPSERVGLLMMRWLVEEVAKEPFEDERFLVWLQSRGREGRYRGQDHLGINVEEVLV